MSAAAVVKAELAAGEGDSCCCCCCTCCCCCAQVISATVAYCLSVVVAVLVAVTVWPGPVWLGFWFGGVYDWGYLCFGNGVASRLGRQQIFLSLCLVFTFFFSTAGAAVAAAHVFYFVPDL